MCLSLVLVSCSGIEATGARFSSLDAPGEAEAVVHLYSPETRCIDLGQMASEILVNGRSRLVIDEGYYAKLRLPPGVYEFSADTDDQPACGGQLFPGRRYDPITLRLAAGDSQFLRYGSSSWARCPSTCERSLGIVDKTEAVSEMQGLEEIAVRQPSSK